MHTGAPREAAGQGAGAIPGAGRQGSADALRAAAFIGVAAGARGAARDLAGAAGDIARALARIARATLVLMARIVLIVVGVSVVTLASLGRNARIALLTLLIALLMVLLLGSTSSWNGGNDDMVAARAQSTVHTAGSPALRVVVDGAVRRDLERIARTRIFFGHHSVGDDILAGLDDVAAAAGVPGVRLAFREARIGANGDPLAKIADFERQARALAERGEIDVAVMKLCYADIDGGTHVDRLVRAYGDAVARIKAAHPGLRLVHVTPPLHARTTDAKSRLQRALGRPVWGDEANVKRADVGDWLRHAYGRARAGEGGGDVLFDLARIESTRPDGTREVHVVGDRVVPMLWPGWTRDGGHLNDAGKRVVARAFASALASAAPPTATTTAAAE